ncbi:MAG TPA: PHP-associated domain-containing protein [Bryobacteraceae bacterium]|nr:PHP-associated domain-containing protein [Bryobacteraceae bacterium]
MQLVTVTDHDSIDAVEGLRRHPDFFLSEEVTCTLPTGTEIHVGVYDINERQHLELQRRRHDIPSLLAYLGEQKLFFTLNHVLSALTGRRVAADFEFFERDFPALETRNGAMLKIANDGAGEMAKWLGKGEVGGSDAHSMAALGSAWTEVPGARTKEEFIKGLQNRCSVAHGESGSMLKLTRDVLSICHSMMLETPWTAPLLPLILGGVPLVIGINYWLEQSFARRWMARATGVGLPVAVKSAPVTVVGEVA